MNWAKQAQKELPLDWAMLTLEEQGRFEKAGELERLGLESMAAMCRAVLKHFSQEAGTPAAGERVKRLQEFVETRHGRLWVLVATEEEIEREVECFALQEQEARTVA